MFESLLEDDFIIRPVKPGDFDGLMALLNTGKAHVAASNVPTTIQQRVEGQDQNAFRLVALLGDEIIGRATLTFGFPAQPATARLTILVREDRRGQGIGTDLLAALLAEADGLGLSRIELAVLRDNHAAIHLYRNFGFEEEQPIGPGSGPVLLMARAM